MVRGLYTAALGMLTQMNKMDVVSNNIANADTAGYKKDTVVTRSFSEEFMNRLDDKADLTGKERIGKVTPGVFVDDIFTNFTTGTTTTTDNPLDVAIMGEGFFCVNVTDSSGNTTEKYTRSGSFTLGPDGTLLTKEGNVVLGENGPIVINGENVTIDEAGQIFVDNTLLDRFKLVDFEDKQTLRKYGDSYYNMSNNSQQKTCTALISPGCLENSNVNPVREMLDLITVSRTYEANQRLIGIHDTILGKTVNEIGRK